MATQRGVREPAIRGLIELKPPLAERLGIESEPNPRTVESYVLTRRAERAWERINRQLAEPAGAVFWIGGPPGCGKTHFLNYVLALEERAGGSGAEPGRRMTVSLELAGRVGGAEVEAYLLDVLAGRLGVESTSSMMWREMRGAAALSVALERARRLGFRQMTVAIDFSASESASVADYFGTLAEVVTGARGTRVTVLAAGRGPAPESAVSLEVAPDGDRETATVAIARARGLDDDAEATARAAYDGVDDLGFKPLAIFPFHPATVRVLTALARPEATVQAIARLARLALEPAGDGRAFPADRLLYPADLAASDELSGIAASHLGEDAAAASAVAREAIDRLPAGEREIASRIVDTLNFEWLCSRRRPLSVSELAALIPQLPAGGADEEWAIPMLTALISNLARATHGVIRFDSDGARFDPEAAGSPELAAFNGALETLERFDPALRPVRSRAELDAALKRLKDAMARAAESAGQTVAALGLAIEESGTGIPSDQRETISEFIRLAEAGPAILIEAAVAGETETLKKAARTISRYGMVAQVAAMAPRIAEMRRYLEATGLLQAVAEQPSGDNRLAAIEAECQLLRVQLGPRVLSGTPLSLEALEARFQKFRWSYVQLYLAAHDQRRRETARLRDSFDTARRHLEALWRLNSIIALGPAEGEGLPERLSALAEEVSQCDFSGRLSPETTPRCPRCGYRLGAPSPETRIDAVFAEIRKALETKLAVLSRSAVARLIREHDRGRRLEGFLKITQASQTDALVRVLDEKLTRYLAGLLDEDLAETATSARPRAVVRRIDTAGLKTSGAKLKRASKRTGVSAGPGDSERDRR